MPACPCPSRLFSYLLPQHVARAREFWWAVGISALIGALYGAFISPIWTEAVAFGQAWAGLIDYSHSPWGGTMLGDSSLQITIPALLLKAGGDPWRISQYLCGFFCALSFAAVTASCFVFTRHGAYSVALAVLMLTYRMVDVHGYPIVYPMGLSQFGQTGQYLCLLALATVAAGFPLAGGLLGGLLGGVHAVWAVCFAFGSIAVTLWRAPAMLRRLLFGFCVMALCSASFQYMGSQSLPKSGPYKAPVVPAALAMKEQARLALARQGGAAPAPAANPSKEASGKVAAEGAKPAPAKKVRGTFEGHNILFMEADSPLKAILKFLTPSAVFLILSVVILREMRRDPRYRVNLPAVRRFIWMVGVPIIATVTFKIYEEFDPRFQLLGMIHQQLPSLAIRAIVNRWMNLSTALVPVLFASVLFFMIRDRKSVVALGVLSLIALSARASWSVIPFQVLDKNHTLTTLAVLGLAWAVLSGREARLIPRMGLERLLSTGFALFLLGFLSLSVLVHARAAHRTGIYTGKDVRDEISAVMRKDSGVLLMSPGVDGAYGYTPQIRTQRPVMPPTMLYVHDKARNRLVHVYCYTDPLRPFAQFYADVRPCFEQRSAAEWALIGRELPAGGVITPDDWKLKLPVTATGGGFNYYRLSGGK